MSLTTTLRALIAKCGEATPGPYGRVPAYDGWVVGPNLERVASTIGSRNMDADAAYIAQLSPEFVRAMAEALIEAEGAQCACSLRERDSGHLIGCWRPALNDALARVAEHAESGEG